MSNGSSILPVFIVLAVVIIGIGIVSALANQAKVTDLRQNGKWIMAKVDRVEHKTRMNPATQMNNQVPQIHHYYVVLASWTDPDTGNSYTFSSDRKSRSPRYVSGDDIPVLVDPNDYTRYHIEI